jgi:hypothetical protein
VAVTDSNEERRRNGGGKTRGQLTVADGDQIARQFGEAFLAAIRAAAEESEIFAAMMNAWRWRWEWSFVRPLLEANPTLVYADAVNEMRRAGPLPLPPAPSADDVVTLIAEAVIDSDDEVALRVPQHR